jgi:DNA invertase Pin-like site-specific DNA recombinase
MAHLLGYARVSTSDQNPDLQLDALKGAGCFRVFVDRASGALDERPELTKALDQLRPGDTLVVWKLDRLGRSLRHLIDTVAELQRRDVGFRSLQESIDTTTPGGKLVFHLFGALAEFERDIIRERTNAGLDAARARGRAGGRPLRMTLEKVAIARQMYDTHEHTVAVIARTLGVSRASVYRHLGLDVGTAPAAPAALKAQATASSSSSSASAGSRRGRSRPGSSRAKA